MTLTKQETDFQNVPGLYEYVYGLVEQDSAWTSSGFTADEMIIGRVYSPLTDAMNAISNLDEGSIRSQSVSLLTALQRALVEIQGIGFGAGFIPPLHPQFPDDGSVLFEWMLPNLRLGFGLEEDVSKSSWFLVSDETLGRVNCFGYLPTRGNDKLFPWLINFLLLHS